MIVEDEGVRRPESNRAKPAGGWTTLHSWIFLGIVTCGLLVVGLQNRYHYLSPLGLGKAYRIDKLFGSIQEFDSSQGWVTAQIPGPGPQLSMMEPPGVKSVPMQMPGMMNSPSVAPEPMPRPGTAKANAPAYAEKESEPAPAVVSTPPVEEKPAKELTDEERFKLFKEDFPEFTEEEFQLANDDLYPSWRKSRGGAGTWPEFLNTYKDFVQWWTDSGSPQEPGAKLWKDFMAGKKK